MLRTGYFPTFGSPGFPFSLVLLLMPLCWSSTFPQIQCGPVAPFASPQLVFVFCSLLRRVHAHPLLVPKLLPAGSLLLLLALHSLLQSFFTYRSKLIFDFSFDSIPGSSYWLFLHTQNSPRLRPSSPKDPPPQCRSFGAHAVSLRLVVALR